MTNKGVIKPAGFQQLQVDLGRLLVCSGAGGTGWGWVGGSLDLLVFPAAFPQLDPQLDSVGHTGSNNYVSFTFRRGNSDRSLVLREKSP